jgi:putative transposase
VRYRFIREQHDWHSVKTLCRVMKVSRGGYYDWLKREPSARTRQDERLTKMLEKLHYQFREAYGAIRLSNELDVLGERCSRHRVARLKRAKSLWTKRRRRFVLTTKADPGHVRYPNVLARQFAAPQTNRVWVGSGRMAVLGGVARSAFAACCRVVNGSELWRRADACCLAERAGVAQTEAWLAAPY